MEFLLCDRGGVPLIFPQYGRASGIAAYAGVGSSRVPTDGVLNRMHWSLIETGVSPLGTPDPAPTAVFAAESDDITLALWPFRFQAVYTVLQQLRSLSLCVHVADHADCVIGMWCCDVVNLAKVF